MFTSIEICMTLEAFTFIVTTQQQPMYCTTILNNNKNTIRNVFKQKYDILLNQKVNLEVQAVKLQKRRKMFAESKTRKVQVVLNKNFMTIIFTAIKK